MLFKNTKMNLDKILNEKFVNELHKPLTSFEGIFLPKAFERYHDAIKKMDVRDDDIWITSFPKSGTTWTQEMVWLIANNLDYEEAKVPLNIRCPFPELSTILDFKSFQQNHPNFKFPDFALDSLKLVNEEKERRFIKTHLPWHLLPLEIQNGIKKPKIIHVIRNPKDILVSYYHHCTLLEGFLGSLEEFFNLFISGKIGYCPYFDSINGFWRNKQLDNVLLITYENMQQNLGDVVNKVAKFLNKEISEQEANKLLKHLSFAEMSNNRAVNFDPLVDILQEVGAWTVPDKKFMRSGTSGSHKEELSEEMIAILDDWIKDNCDKTGIYFD